MPVRRWFPPATTVGADVTESHSNRHRADTVCSAMWYRSRVRMLSPPPPPPPSTPMPLAGLDAVPWNRLHHAYGVATDVPGHLRSLRSADPDVRQNACAALL